VVALRPRGFGQAPGPGLPGEVDRVALMARASRPLRKLHGKVATVREQSKLHSSASFAMVRPSRRRR
jgi:hypothetical protein